MKKILIIYPYMMVGGSTTSLLSLLNEFDYNHYTVDLALLSNDGDLQSLIPSSVNILPSILPFSEKELRRKKQRSLISLFRRLYCYWLDKTRVNSNAHMQVMALDNLRFTVTTGYQYDISISYLEGFPLYYNAEKVNAKKKIAWIHVDYKGTALKKEFDCKALGKMDNIVLVSESCKKSFDSVFPEYSKRSFVIENILSSRIVKARAFLKVDDASSFIKRQYTLISVCRIEVISKGLNRGIVALGELKREGLDLRNMIWYIIGSGSSQDENYLRQLIAEYSLADNIKLMGARANPMPYLKQCDVFFLPSYYEGKPMAVTEAQMVGVVPLVTNYSSAHEQIIHEKTGYIIQNNDAAIKTALRDLLSGKLDIPIMKKELLQNDLSNTGVIDKIYALFKL